MRELELQLSEISPDDVYAFSYPHLPERYDGLAEKFPGLPLLVVDSAQRIISGHDYRLLLSQRGETHASVLQADLAAENALLLNYNILNRLFGLNLYEKLLFLKKISPLCPMENIRRRAELDFTLNDHLLDSLDLLLAEPFRFCLASGRLCLKAALRLSETAEEDRQAMIGLLRACKFSECQQLLLVQWLEEIAFREKKSLVPILAASGLNLLLEKEMPQKKILDILRKLRYPELARAESEWKKWQKKMAAGSVALTHAPFFARKEVQVTMTLKNRTEVEKLLAKLKKIV